MRDTFQLYSYFRSSASHRVRIALHYKSLPFEYVPVHLVKEGGEQFKPEYKKLNPHSQVPCLVHNGRPLAQSMAILEYLENICPQPPLFPIDPYERGLVIQICEIINSGIQPLQNLSVTAELEKRFHITAEQKTAWIHHWIQNGLNSVETILKKTAGAFCLGDTVTTADCFLIPQIFSAQRFGVDLSPYKQILLVNEHTSELEAFRLAEPSRQPDFSA